MNTFVEQKLQGTLHAECERVLRKDEGSLVCSFNEKYFFSLKEGVTQAEAASELQYMLDLIYHLNLNSDIPHLLELLEGMLVLCRFQVFTPYRVSSDFWEDIDNLRLY